MFVKDSPEIVITEEFDEALTRLRRGDSLFLTGKAGTGKSTLIRLFLASTERNVVVAAPTGIAALNVEGYTIHRLFSFSSGITVQDVQSSGYYPRRFAKAIKNLETLIIDEASMIRADLFDCLVVALERFGPKPGQRFGGVQVVLVGDLYQLPPVVTEAEVEYFSTRYSSPYFFAADRYDRKHFPLIELSTVFRQIGDTGLLNILNAVRDGALLEDAQVALNKRTNRTFRPPLDEFWLTLATTNRIAGARNREMLDQIQEPVLKHFAVETGELDGFDTPTEYELTYKIGAQIMMLNNDSANRWANGTMGKVVAHTIENDETVVTVELANEKHVDVRPHRWDILRPVVEDRTLRHETVGAYTQLPFRLAWSITIHKSQGQTLEKLVVDLTGGTFAYGQLYVALSRCTTMDGLVLRKDVEPKDLKVDQRIRRFLASGGNEIGTRGRVYLGICTVGDVGRMWRPRPAEIALITEDGTEITTLVNPTRDMGDARDAYGISASDVQLAPLLAEAWAALAPHLAGRTPVGLNIDRDLGYLDYELKRNGYLMPMPLGINLDESKLTSKDLAGLNASTAIDRARALRNIALAQHLAEAHGEVFSEPDNRTGFLLERGQTPEAFHAGGISPASKTSAEVLAEHLSDVVARSPLSSSAKGLLCKVETKIGQTILGLNDEGSVQLGIAEVLIAGARVCFTGTAIDVDGKKISRAQMETLAESHGLIAVKNVTKSKCEALVSAEEGSQSTKAKNAHNYGKPVFQAAQFLAWTRCETTFDTAETAVVVIEKGATPAAEPFSSQEGPLRPEKIENTATENKPEFVVPLVAPLEMVTNSEPISAETVEHTALDSPEHRKLPLGASDVEESQITSTPTTAAANYLEPVNIPTAQNSAPELFTNYQQPPSQVLPETVEVLRPRNPSRRTWRFHITMGAIFLFLTVGMFLFAIISVIVAPESEAWAPIVAIAWVLAILQLPVWLVWGIVRRKSARKLK